MQYFKNIAAVLALFLILIGAGNAVGYLIANKAWLPLVGVALLIAAAVPTCVQLVKKYIIG